MSFNQTQYLKQYGMAIASVTIALLLMLALDPVLQLTQAPFLLFFGAVAISAWYGGRGPGIVATLLSAVFANYFFQYPQYSWSLNLVGVLRMALFILEGVLVSLLVGALRTAQAQARKNFDRLKASEAEIRDLNQALQHQVDELQTLAAAKLASEDRYRVLISSIDEGFGICEMLLDEDGKAIDFRILEVNPVFEPLTGLEQAVGKTARELVPDVEDVWFEIYGRVALTREPIRFEQKSGPLKRWFDINAFAIGEPESHLFGILFTNITARKAVEQERERFLAVGSDLQVITGSDGYFQWVSPTFERVLGWTVKEMTSRPWTEFVHPDDINPSVLEAEYLFKGSDTLAFENRYRHKDGSYRWLLWKAQQAMCNFQSGKSHRMLLVSNCTRTEGGKNV
jgi:PAS domain S-box-containing protein